MEGIKNFEGGTFSQKLWQRNYYEHIIRGGNELENIREYIRNNPMEWQLDFENREGIKDYKDITIYFNEKLKVNKAFSESTPNLTLRIFSQTSIKRTSQ